MRRWGWMAVVAAVGLLAGDADALVLCAKGRNGVPREGVAPKLRTACKGKEVQVDPDALGLRGPQGEAGADGAAGADGSPGLSGLEVKTANSADVIETSFQTATATASCSSGKKVIAGGVEFVPVVGGTVSEMGVRESKR